jgi:hypothetical protein
MVGRICPPDSRRGGRADLPRPSGGMTRLLSSLATGRVAQAEACGSSLSTPDRQLD